MDDQQFWQLAIAFIVVGSAIWSLWSARRDRLSRAIRRGKL